METILDIFGANAFSCIALTEGINNLPYIPGRAGQVIDWKEEGVPVTTIALDQQDNVLTMVNPTPRGGPGTSMPKNLNKIRNLNIPHYQIDDGIMAEEVQGVRVFGSATQLKTVESLVNQRMSDHVQLRIDPTLEYQRIGAVKGLILNADGTTLYDLFSEFGVTQETEIDFDLNNASPASGIVRKKCAQAVRLVAKNLGGIPYRYIHAFCGDNFFDDLIAHPEVRATYLNQQEAAQLRGGYAFQWVNYGGILFENYRGAVGATDFVNTDKVHIFPVGVPGMWRTVNAPADYVETVNTIGLPRYAKQWRMPDDKGVNMQVQSNSLSFCSRPKSLILGKRT